MRDPSLPKPVDAVFARGLAKDPAQRWPTAVQFVRALEHALDGPEETVAAASEPDATRVMAPGGRFDSPSGHRLAPTPPAPADRGRRLLALLAGALLLAAIVAVVLAGANGGGGNDRASDDAPAARNEPATKKKAGRKPAAQATAEPQATSEPAAQEPATEEPSNAGPAAAAPAGDDPEQLDARGYALLQQGQAEQSIPYFQKAIDLCGQSPAAYCGYALFNMGTALNRAGRPQEAIPYLQERLTRFPGDRPGIVRKELKSACKAAGRKCR